MYEKELTLEESLKQMIQGFIKKKSYTYQRNDAEDREDTYLKVFFKDLKEDEDRIEYLSIRDLTFLSLFDIYEPVFKDVNENISLLIQLYLRTRKKLNNLIYNEFYFKLKYNQLVKNDFEDSKELIDLIKKKIYNLNHIELSDIEIKRENILILEDEEINKSLWIPKLPHIEMWNNANIEKTIEVMILFYKYESDIYNLYEEYKESIEDIEEYQQYTGFKNKKLEDLVELEKIEEETLLEMEEKAKEFYFNYFKKKMKVLS